MTLRSISFFACIMYNALVVGRDDLNSKEKKIVFALLISTFLAAIEVTIISTAMPTIVDVLGGFELISWVFAIYLLSISVTTPIWGKLADLTGRKKIFIIGVTIFLIGSALSGLSQNMGQLIFFRAIQGIGAGAINPMTFTIVADVFNLRQRARVQGLISAMWGIAAVLGPLTGGFLTDYVSWRWIFLINIPFGLLAIWMISRNLVEQFEKKKPSIDYGGALSFTIGISALLLALLSLDIESSIGLSSTQLIILFIVALIFIVLFIIVERRHKEPMIPLQLFIIKDITFAALASFLTSMILISMSAFLPLWIQNVLGMGATATGIVLIPLSVGWPIGSVLSGRVFIEKLGIKQTALLGVSFIFIGSVLLTTITPETPLTILALYIFVIGLGFGFSMTSFTVIIQSSAPPEMRGSAGSLITLFRTLGQAIGVAVLGTSMNLAIQTVASENPAMAVADGLHVVFIISAIISVLSLIVTSLIPKRSLDEYKY